MDTFVVRVWRPVVGGVDAPELQPSPRRLRGVLRHIGSRSDIVFEGPEELVAMLSSEWREPTGSTGAAGDARDEPSEAVAQPRVGEWSSRPGGRASLDRRIERRDG
jgi:hypothetical protein